MENDHDLDLAELALQSAGVEIGNVVDRTVHQILIKNHVSVHIELVQKKLEQPPPKTPKYVIFRPRSTGRALAEVIKKQRDNPEAFFEEHAADYLHGSDASDTYDHESAPLSYKSRTDKILDRTEKRNCGYCSGQGTQPE